MRPKNLRPKLKSALNTGARMLEMPSAGMFLRLGAILILTGLLASSFYWSSAAFTSGKSSTSHRAADARDEITAPVAAAGLSSVASVGVGNYSSLFNLPQSPPPITVSTYASDCSTPKTVFNLQDTNKTVCAKVTGAQFGWSIIWSNANFVAVQSVPVESGTSTFTLTSASSLGDWRVILFEPFGGSVQKIASFTVIDAANPQADLSISTSSISGSVTSGGQAIFTVQVSNPGPDAAATEVSDTIPANTTFVSFGQLSGPLFTCTSPMAGDTNGSTVCTVGRLARGESATFIGIYEIGAVASGTVISNTASVSSTTNDPKTSNNSSTAELKVGLTPCHLSSPANITVDAAGQAGAVVNYATPTSTGDCGQPPEGQTSPISCNPASGSFFGAGTTTVICVAQAGPAVSFQVVVNDPGALSILLNGANSMTVECGNAFTDPGASAVNGTSQSVPVTVTYPSGFNPDAPAVGNYEVAYTATEGQNSVSTTRTVIVFDAEAPVITLAGQNPMTVRCAQTFVDPGASANDACEGAKPVNSSGTVDTNTPGVYTITYTASDSQNHTSTTTRTVTVEGPGTLSISLNGANPFALECGTDFNDPGATAVNCNGDPVPVTISGEVDNHTPGSYMLTYIATEGQSTVSTTRTVNVSDTQAPVITVVEPNPMTVSCGTAFVDPGASALDACEGLRMVTSSGAVEMSTPGTYTITYTASDSLNHTATATRTVIVEAGGGTAPPTITINGAPQMTIECGAAFTDPGATAIAGCGGSVPVTTSGTVNSQAPGTYTITYTACVEATPGQCDPLQTAQAVRTVTVQDTTAPVITLIGASPLLHECHTPFTDPGATAQDACEGSVPVTSTGTVNENTPGTYTITYSASDDGNHSATKVRTVNVVDTTGPMINTCPASRSADANTDCTAPVPDFTGDVQASDSCGGAVTITQSPAAGTLVDAGETVVTITARDIWNNSSTCTTTFTVNAPQLTELGTADIWVGLKNSDDVGTKFDLLVEILRNDDGQPATPDFVVGSGQVNGVAGGGSGFNNAIQRAISQALSGPASFCPTNRLSIRLSVRVAADSSHVSGTARLWYNDAAANSRFTATVNGSSNTYFLRDGFVLATAAGPGPKKTIDVFVHRNQNDNPFKPFGTWTKTF
ncbi:MAG: DUF5011 domain-containing protein [Pyrinomonadaceae bacterium]|nr:DUF5011 domain-containing protein [Pyrinomonadaceae bacterium]